MLRLIPKLYLREFILDMFVNENISIVHIGKVQKEPELVLVKHLDQSQFLVVKFVQSFLVSRNSGYDNSLVD